MSSASDICLSFSYIFDKLGKITNQDLTHTLQSIKIQIELILVQIDEVHQLSEIECIKEWAKACYQSLYLGWELSLQDAILFREITQILLEIVRRLKFTLDKYYGHKISLCIANEYGNIINHDEEFQEMMGDVSKVNFLDYMDVKSNVDNSKIVFYRLFNLSEGITTKMITQNKQNYFQRIQVNYQVVNFEFGNDKDFNVYPSDYIIPEENLRKLLVLQFINLPFESSQQLDDFVKSSQFIELMRKRFSE